MENTAKRKFATIAILAAFLAIFMISATTAQATTAVPGNDDIADATPILSLPYTDVVDTTDATLEAGEPTYTCGFNVKNTVWYSYTPGTIEFLVVSTAGSGFDTVLHVYEDLGGGNLQLVGCDADSIDGLRSELVFEAQAGASYLISVGGEDWFGLFSGNLEFSVNLAGAFTSCSSIDLDVPETECSALQDLYTNTGDTSWTDHSGWLEINQVCAWHGISCSGDRIESIDLGSNNLIGELTTDFTGIPNLVSLDLSGNQLTGGFSTIAGNLPTDLISLNLSLNQLTGSIPVTFPGFTSLKTLDLSGNSLSGDLSAAIANLPTGLDTLNLGENGFSGTIPGTISDLTLLTELDVSFNPALNGIIPLSITGLSLDLFDFEGAHLCEPDDPSYDVWKATVTDYLPGLCNLPDLTITDITISPADPLLGETVTATVQITNAGTGLDTLFAVDLYVDTVPNGCFDFGDAFQEIPSLAAGASLDVTFPMEIPEPGPHEFYAYIDADCNIEENDEGNNSFGPAPFTITADSLPPTGSFVTPLANGTALIPRTLLIVNASDNLTGVQSVTFWAEYNSSWHELSTDTNGADGWSYLWPTYAIPKQTIKIKAEIRDFAGNMAPIQISNVSLDTHHTFGNGFTSRGSSEQAGEWVVLRRNQFDFVLK